MGKVLAAMQNRSAHLLFPGRGNVPRIAGEEPGKYFLLIDNMLVVLGFFVVFR